MHVAIAGNIGSGKTTLAEILGKHYGWDMHFEENDENPYLADFYNDMQRWAFNLQIHFLNSRFSKIKEIRLQSKNLVQDRTIYEDSYIFAKNLFNMGLFSERDYNSYINLFELMSSLVEPPDIVIYLRSSVNKLLEQISKRGRKYEQNIRADYLEKLNKLYENWAENYNSSKLLIVDVTKSDFASNPEDLLKITNNIDALIQNNKSIN